MAPRTRTKVQREKDLQQIAEMYLSGRTQADTGNVLNLTQQTVSNDLKTLQQRWLDSSLRDFDELRAEQLAKIDRLEAEYWAGWSRSTRPRTRKGKKSKSSKGPMGDSDESSVVVEERDGNPSWLAGVDKCIERRCKLLGLDAPVKTDLSINQTFADFVLAAAGDIDGEDGAESEG
jgi:hypothetical protein